jgi:hypothetical protein
MTGSILTIAALLSPAGADTTKNPQLVAQLKATGTQSDRLKLLPNDATDWTFDFAAQDGYTFSPASVVNANTASWPVHFPPFALSNTEAIVNAVSDTDPNICPDRGGK